MRNGLHDDDDNDANDENDVDLAITIARLILRNRQVKMICGERGR